MTPSEGSKLALPLRSRPSRRAGNKLQRVETKVVRSAWSWPHLGHVLQPTQTLGQPPRSDLAGAWPASTARGFPYLFRTDKKKAPNVSARCFVSLPILVGANGLEPSTPTMSRWCSNQLSYAPGEAAKYTPAKAPSAAPSTAQTTSPSQATATPPTAIPAFTCAGRDARPVLGRCWPAQA